MRTGEFSINGSPTLARVTSGQLQLRTPPPTTSRLGDYRDLVCVLGAFGCIVGGLIVRGSVPWLGWVLIGVGALLLIPPLSTAVGQLLVIVVGGTQLAGSLLTRAGSRHDAVRPGLGRRRTKGAPDPWSTSSRTLPLTDLHVGPLSDRGRPCFTVESPDGPLAVVGSRRRRGELQALHRSLVPARPHR